MVFFPSFYSADINNVTNPFSNPLSGYSVEGIGDNAGVSATDTSGYNCVNYTCVKVSSNATYKISVLGSDTKAKNKCLSSCQSVTHTSLTNNVPGGTS
jgi:hypothetical protein